MRGSKTKESNPADTVRLRKQVSMIQEAHASLGGSSSQRDFYGTYAYDVAKENFQQQTDFFSDTRLLNIAKEVADSHKEFNIAVGVIASADTWTSNSELIKFMNENYGVLCEEMETASAAQICQTAGVPFIGIRVISNNYTNGEDFSISTAYNAQRFTLHVVASLIQAVKGGF